MKVPGDPELARLCPDTDHLVLLLLVWLPDQDAVLVLVVLHLRQVDALPTREIDLVTHLGRAQVLLHRHRDHYHRNHYHGHYHYDHHYLGTREIRRKLPLCPVAEDEDLSGCERLKVFSSAPGNNQYLSKKRVKYFKTLLRYFEYTTSSPLT